MMPRGRFLLATATGLVLAGLVHIGVVLLIPRLSQADALSRAPPGQTLHHARPVFPPPTGHPPSPAQACPPNPAPAPAGGPRP